MARVKVLLTKDVPELGHAGEVYAVAGGYARNYLMPRGLAVLATRGAMKQAEEIKAAATRRRARDRANAEAQAQMIAGKKLVFAANAGENDRLYGSVTSSDIAEKLSALVGFEVDRRRIELEHGLRDLGIHDISIRLMPEVTASIPSGRRARGRRLGRRRSARHRQSRQGAGRRRLSRCTPSPIMKQRPGR
jgi:large subunit ribosomal protein L9